MHNPSSCRSLPCTRWFLTVLLLVAPWLARGAGSVALGDLDLSQLQDENGRVQNGELLRTDSGMVLRPGASLWIDLKETAIELKAVISPLMGSRGGPVRCRFATANDIREAVVNSGSKPVPLSIPLKGQKFLIIQSNPESGTDGIRLHITDSSLSFEQARPEVRAGPAPITWETPQWRLRIDGRTGGIVDMSSPADKHAMQWVRQAAPWGTGWLKIGDQQVAWDRPASIQRVGERRMEVIYEAPSLRVHVQRWLDEQNQLRETYTFENSGPQVLEIGRNGLGIRVPLVDSYPGADVCLTDRCHVHIWAGGNAAYVNALRMGGDAPHLGVVLTEGSIGAYSIYDRIQHSNDRGQFVLHPAPVDLAPGQKMTLSWTLFWHNGWADFEAKRAQLSPAVRLSAEEYAVTVGQPLRIHASATGGLDGAKLSVNGRPVQAKAVGETMTAEVPTAQPGEYLVEIQSAEGHSFLRALATPEPLKLIEARVRFIIEHQQKSASGEALDGAYLIYDNDEQKLFYDRDFADHNAGRERLGMGVLAALYLPLCQDAGLKEKLSESLQRYHRFVRTQLQNESGAVFNDVNRNKQVRLYNYPWVVQFHLAMYRAYGRVQYLREALETCRMYYNKGGERFYCIGMPVLDMLNALREAGWDNERKEMLARFGKHARVILGIGNAYPKHEVNYEQSIVGPAAQLLLEMYLATKDAAYLEGAENQLRLLELFGGQQPDYHLHEVAIRHWDDYWFGKRQLYGDTFPHYWSTITGVAFAMYADVSGKSEYQSRGRGILNANLCLFTPDGRGSCAYVYPLTVNGERGKFFDPYANDQDWALVAWLQILGPNRLK
jgi:hypothetical protein